MAALLIAVIYLAFISLGLPDSLLGSAWPSMRIVFDVPSSFAGYVSMTICLMTIISSLISPTLIKKIQTKWIVIFSILLTIIGLLGFSFSSKYWMLFIFAIPYGLGAGSIDAALNHYVALNYSSRVMNFLHCFYGIGAVISPNIMSIALRYAHWNQGYRWTAYIQIGILLICILSIPLWKMNEKKDVEIQKETKGIFSTLKIPAVILTLIAFFSYCAGEATCFLWTSTYFKNRFDYLGEDIIAACGSLIFLGLMLGRLLSGIFANRLNDRNLIRIGIGIELIGIILISINIDNYILPIIGFIVIGLGMGPIYPSIQHMAPINFGHEYAASVIGLQMASAYLGSTFMPTVFGLIEERTGYYMMPIYLGIFLILNISLLEISYLINKQRKIGK